MKLKNKIAVVTGASRGIGKAIALAFSKEGATVVVCYLKQKEKAEKVVREIKKNSPSSFSIHLDVRSRKSIRSAVTEITKRLGSKIDILVNNAGVNLPNDFDKISDFDWKEVLRTNLDGIFMTCQEFLPNMNDGGRIINISSVSAQIGGPRSSHYAVSKAGVIALTQNIALFVARRKILVNAIAPGYIKSPMAQAAKKLPIIKRIPLGRLGTYDEVAKTAVFLACEDSSYITAQVINVNGGSYF